MDKIFYKVKDLVATLRTMQQQYEPESQNNALVLPDNYPETEALLAVDPALVLYQELPESKIEALNHDQFSLSAERTPFRVYVLKESQFARVPLYWSSVCFIKGGELHVA